MAVSDISDEAIYKATGAPWSHWLEVFTMMDAKELSHKEIARKLAEDHKVPGWWCQMLTVKFEQEIGRRKPGDSRDGFSAGVSSTINGELDQVYQQWQKALEERKTYNTVVIAEQPTLTQTENWRYWKLKLKNSTRVYVNFSPKAPWKVLVQITHEKLSDESAIAPWKAYWRSVLEDVFNKRL